MFVGVKQRIVTLLSESEMTLADLALDVYGKKPTVADPLNNMRTQLSGMRKALAEHETDTRFIRTTRKPGVNQSTYRLVRVGNL